MPLFGFGKFRGRSNSDGDLSAQSLESAAPRDRQIQWNRPNERRVQDMGSQYDGGSSSGRYEYYDTSVRSHPIGHKIIPSYPTFSNSPGESAESYIEEHQLFCDLFELNDKEKVRYFILGLKGQANRWYLSKSAVFKATAARQINGNANQIASSINGLTLPFLKTQLLQQYQARHRQHRASFELAQCVQGAQESMAEYSTRIVELNEIANAPVPHHMRQGQCLYPFMAGIFDKSIQMQVLAARPNTLDEAIDVAITLESSKHFVEETDRRSKMRQPPGKFQKQGFASDFGQGVAAQGAPKLEQQGTHLPHWKGPNDNQNRQQRFGDGHDASGPRQQGGQNQPYGNRRNDFNRPNEMINAMAEFKEMFDGFKQMSVDMKRQCEEFKRDMPRSYVLNPYDPPLISCMIGTDAPAVEKAPAKSFASVEVKTESEGFERSPVRRKKKVRGKKRTSHSKSGGSIGPVHPDSAPSITIPSSDVRQSPSLYSIGNSSPLRSPCYPSPDAHWQLTRGSSAVLAIDSGQLTVLPHSSVDPPGNDTLDGLCAVSYSPVDFQSQELYSLTDGSVERGSPAWPPDILPPPHWF